MGWAWCVILLVWERHAYFRSFGFRERQIVLKGCEEARALRRKDRIICLMFFSFGFLWLEETEGPVLVVSDLIGVLPRR